MRSFYQAVQACPLTLVDTGSYWISQVLLADVMTAIAGLISPPSDARRQYWPRDNAQHVVPTGSCCPQQLSMRPPHASAYGIYGALLREVH